MARYLQPNIIKAAVARLAESRASKSMLNFLVFKRASVRAQEPAVSFSTSNSNLGLAVDDLALLALNGSTLPPEVRDKPYVDVFSPSDSAWRYRNAGWRTNGTGPALSGAIWRGIVDIVSEKPRSGQLSPGYIQKLPGVLLKSGANLPALTDCAIWYHRTTDFDAVFGTITDSHQLDERLRDSFTNQVGLTSEEIAALFAEDAKPLDGQSLDDILRDTVANPQEYLPDLGGGSGELNEMLAAFEALANDARVGLRVSHELLLRLAAALCAKRFLILTGLAGSGKTKLAQGFAHWATPPTEDGEETNPHHAMVPVGADWTGNENVLGYPNGLDKTSYVTKPALDLILHAQDHPDVPHFLLLDEMNLSHVERYFSDILSAIESEAKIPLHRDAERKAKEQVIPADLELPKNLFIIGTVNVDETTYMFSPKVLDRANVIEFRMDAGELAGFLGNPAKPDLSKLDGKGASFGKAFVEAAKNPVAVPADVKAAYDAEMLLLFKTLQGHGAEFGYRTAYETARFVHFYELLGGGKVWNAKADEGKGAWSDEDDEGRGWFEYAMDCVVFQKILPKLHGSRSKLGPVLKELWFLCVNDEASRIATTERASKHAKSSADKKAEPVEEAARLADAKKAEPSTIIPPGAPYPLSAEKIGRMWRLLMANGFASFAEA